MRTLLALVLLGLPVAASAGVTCSTIDDPDQRAYCRAIETNSVGNCSTISDYALRQTCRARVGGNVNPCNTVTSQWQREECRRAAAKKYAMQKENTMVVALGNRSKSLSLDSPSNITRTRWPIINLCFRLAIFACSFIKRPRRCFAIFGSTLFGRS